MSRTWLKAPRGCFSFSKNLRLAVNAFSGNNNYLSVKKRLVHRYQARWRNACNEKSGVVLLQSCRSFGEGLPAWWYGVAGNCSRSVYDLATRLSCIMRKYCPNFERLHSRWRRSVSLRSSFSVVAVSPARSDFMHRAQVFILTVLPESR